MNRWKRRARALARLAENQRGKPEGDVARAKLLEMVNKYPQARDYEAVRELAHRDFLMSDLGKMKRQGVSTDGRWTGTNLAHAIKLMIEDYQQRLANHKPQLPEKQ